ncbi:hypothetical protein JCM12681A_06650 [Streptomyces mexicanus]
MVRPGARVATAAAAGLAAGSMVLSASVPALAMTPGPTPSSPAAATPPVQPLVEPPAAPTGPVPPLVEPPYPPVTPAAPTQAQTTLPEPPEPSAPTGPSEPTEPGGPTAPVPPLVEPPAQPQPSQTCQGPVAAGDTLWALAGKLLGSGGKWRELYDANRTAIESAARAHGFAASDGGRLIFPETNLDLPGGCTGQATGLIDQALSGLAALTGTPPCTQGTFLMGMRGAAASGRDEFTALMEALEKALRGSGSAPGGVTAFKAPAPADFAAALRTAGLTLPADYPHSVFLGAAELLSALMTHLQCPGEKVVLTGYGQGAQAVRTALGMLPSALRARIAHVLLFGDPTAVPGGMSVDQLKAAVPTTTYCRTGDPLCDGDPKRVLECLTATGQCPQTGYEKEAAQAAEAIGGVRQSR